MDFAILEKSYKGRPAQGFSLVLDNYLIPDTHKFFTYKEEAHLPHPNLLIDGYGEVSGRVSSSIARRIHDTFAGTDSGPVLIPAEKISINNSNFHQSLNNIVDEVKESLDCQNWDIQPELEGLWIYDNDVQPNFTAKNATAEPVGTLVITLCSEYNGQVYILRNYHQSNPFTPTNSSNNKYSYYAFYADCSHRVENVEGIRASLVYTLVKRGLKEVPELPDEHLEQLKVSLKGWKMEDKIPNITYVLAGDYKNTDLTFENLKAEDKVMFELLQSIIPDTSITLHLGYAQYTETKTDLSYFYGPNASQGAVFWWYKQHIRMLSNVCATGKFFQEPVPGPVLRRSRQVAHPIYKTATIPDLGPPVPAFGIDFQCDPLNQSIIPKNTVFPKNFHRSLALHRCVSSKTGGPWERPTVTQVFELPVLVIWPPFDSVEFCYSIGTFNSAVAYATHLTAKYSNASYMDPGMSDTWIIDLLKSRHFYIAGRGQFKEPGLLTASKMDFVLDLLHSMTSPQRRAECIIDILHQIDLKDPDIIPVMLKYREEYPDEFRIGFNLRIKHLFNKKRLHTELRSLLDFLENRASTYDWTNVRGGSFLLPIVEELAYGFLTSLNFFNLSIEEQQRSASQVIYAVCNDSTCIPGVLIPYQKSHLGSLLSVWMRALFNAIDKIGQFKIASHEGWRKLAGAVINVLKKRISQWDTEQPDKPSCSCEVCTEIHQHLESTLRDTKKRTHFMLADVLPHLTHIGVTELIEWDTKKKHLFFKTSIMEQQKNRVISLLHDMEAIIAFSSTNLDSTATPLPEYFSRDLTHDYFDGSKIRQKRKKRLHDDADDNQTEEDEEHEVEEGSEEEVLKDLDEVDSNSKSALVPPKPKKIKHIEE